MSAADVIAGHRQAGSTSFSHHKGQCFVQYPKCGCGEQMHPSRHAQHVLDALTAAGYAVVIVDHDFLPVEGHPDDDECTYRADGTDATYCGESRDGHGLP